MNQRQAIQQLSTDAQDRENGYLPMYVLYDHPKDYPDYYVVRRWKSREGLEPDPQPFLWRKDLEQVHKNMARMGLVFIPRDPTDDPVIMGTYL